MLALLAVYAPAALAFLAVATPLSRQAPAVGCLTDTTLDCCQVVELVRPFCPPRGVEKSHIYNEV